MVLYRGKITSLIGDANLQGRTLNAVRYHSVRDEDCPDEARQNIIWKVLWIEADSVAVVAINLICV